MHQINLINDQSLSTALNHSQTARNSLKKESESSELSANDKSTLSTASDGTDSFACGALDKLLATLAIESDNMDKQLAQIDNVNRRLHRTSNGQNSANDSGAALSDDTHSSSANDDDVFTYPPDTKSFSNGGVHTNLCDVIANLTDFTRHESIRQHRSHHRHPCLDNNMQRLTSESENSSSISPSLSERSNIVSWSDQV